MAVCTVSQCMSLLHVQYQTLSCPKCGNCWCHQRLIAEEIISFLSTPSWKAVSGIPGELASLHFWGCKGMLSPSICFISLCNEKRCLTILYNVQIWNIAMPLLKCYSGLIKISRKWHKFIIVHIYLKFWSLTRLLNWLMCQGKTKCLQMKIKKMKIKFRFTGWDGFQGWEIRT